MRKQIFLLLSLALSQAVFSQTDSLLFAVVTEPKPPMDAGDPLFYGRQYVTFEHFVEGIPFYTDQWQKGTIIYRDVAYRDVMMKYDLVRDEVLVLHPNGHTPVVLFMPRIHSFTLGNKQFVNLPAGEIVPFTAGIYEELSRGPLLLYAKRAKLLNETIVVNVLERKFLDNHTYYVKKEGKFIHVKRENVIMNLLGEKKKESKALLKREGIKFRKNPEAALLAIVNFYNQSSR